MLGMGMRTRLGWQYFFTIQHREAGNGNEDKARLAILFTMQHRQAGNGNEPTLCTRNCSNKTLYNTCPQLNKFFSTYTPLPLCSREALIHRGHTSFSELCSLSSGRGSLELSWRKLNHRQAREKGKMYTLHTPNHCIVYVVPYHRKYW